MLATIFGQRLLSYTRFQPTFEQGATALSRISGGGGLAHFGWSRQPGDVPRGSGHRKKHTSYDEADVPR